MFTMQEAIDYTEKNFKYIKNQYGRKNQKAISLGNMYDMANKHCGPAERGMLPVMVDEFEKEHKLNK